MKKSVIAAFLAAVIISLPTVSLAGEAEPMMRPMPVPTESPGSGVELAAIKVTQAEAVATARKVLPIDEALGEPNVNVHQSKTEATWNLTWQSPRNQADRVSISVVVDATTGVIRSYNRSVHTPDKVAEPLTLTRTEALAKANEWLDKLAAPYKANLRLLDAAGYGYMHGASTSFTFNWDRQKGHSPVVGQGVTVAINARTGQLERFQLNWREDLRFAEVVSIPPMITDAYNVYRNQLGVRLQYQRFQKPGMQESEWRLVYRPVTGYWPYVDRMGKQLLNREGKVIDPASWPAPKLVPASAEPYAKPAQPLTMEQALALAQKVAGLSEPPTNTSYNEYGEETKTKNWNFSWQKEGELREGEYNVHVNVDAARGVVTNFNKWGRYEPARKGEEPAVTLEQAHANALEFVRSFRPDLAGNLLLMIQQTTEKRPVTTSYYLQFQRVKNLIPVSEHGASVEIDARTGAVRSFYGVGEFSPKETFPSAEGLILPAEALERVLEHQGLALTWVGFANPVDIKRSRGAEPTEYHLVWAPGRSMAIQFIDARTGAPLDHSGRDLVEASRRPVDIEGHFAQREIELLWARGIFELKDGKFNPNQKASGAELARWLVLAKGLRPIIAYNFAGRMGARPEAAAKLALSAEAPYFGAALQAGILLPEDFEDGDRPDAPISRELFALWTVRAMGYGKIAAMKNRIEMPFADAAAIGARYANAVALLHGLEVVRGDTMAQFQPQRSITRGEAARILFAVTSETSGPYWK